jgi:tetratricopeptide (TPR) repeat protein
MRVEIELKGFDWDYQKRAYVYAERGDYDNAIEDYTKAIEKDEAPESYQWRGEIFLKKRITILL